jgi:hypothetical protein
MHAPSSGVDTQREGYQKLPLWTRCIERRAQHSGLLYAKDRRNTVMYVECTKNQGGCAAFMSLCEHLLNAPTEAVH